MPVNLSSTTFIAVCFFCFVTKLCFVPLCSLDADVWKKFLSRPALPFILRLLRGLATQHPPTQVSSATWYACTRI